MPSPDFRLVVGADVKASYDAMKSDLESVISDLNKNPQKIKLEFDLNSGIGGFKDFQNKIIAGMTGIGEAIRFNMEQLNEIGRTAREIASKDFTAAFDLSGLFKDDQKNKLAQYKKEIVDYFETVRSAVTYMTSTTKDGEVRPQFRGFKFDYKDLEYLEKLRGKLNQFQSMHGLKGIGEDIQLFVNKYSAAFETIGRLYAKQHGEDKAADMFTMPKVPTTVADQARGSLMSLADSVKQLKDAMASESSSMDSSVKPTEAHTVAIRDAAEAEKLKGEVSSENVPKIEGEAAALEKSTAASEKDAEASEKAAEAKEKKADAIAKGAESAESEAAAEEKSAKASNVSAEAKAKLAEQSALATKSEKEYIDATDGEVEKINAQEAALKSVSDTLRQVQTQKHDLAGIAGGTATEEYKQLVELEQRLQGLKDAGYANPAEKIRDEMSTIRKELSDTLQAMNLFKMASADTSKTDAEALRMQHLKAMEEEYYADLERKQAEASAKIQSQIDADFAKRHEAIAKEEADYERLYNKEVALYNQLENARDAQLNKLGGEDTLNKLSGNLNEASQKMAALNSNTLEIGENMRRLKEDFVVLADPGASLEAKKRAYESFNETLAILNRQIRATADEEKKLATDRERQENALHRMNDALGVYETKFRDIKSRIEKLGDSNVTGNLLQSYEKLRSILDTMKSDTAGADKRLEAQERWGVALQETSGLLREQEKAVADAARQQSELASAASKAAQDVGGLYERIAGLSDASKMKLDVGDLDRIVNALRTLRDETASVEQRKAALEELRGVFDRISESVDNLKRAEQEEAAQAAEQERARRQLESSLTQAYKLYDQLGEAQRKYAASAKVTGAQGPYGNLEESREKVQSIIDDLEKLRNAEGKIDAAKVEDLTNRLRALKTETAATTSQLQNAGNAVQRYFGKGLTQLKSRLSYTFGFAAIVMKTVNEIKKMISTAVELDTALNQLQIVTRGSASDMEAYSKRVSQMAKETGQSTKDLIDATTVYARLGFSMDESAALSKYTAMLQGVGDIDASAAQDSITAIVKAFNIGVNDIESVMDKMVTVGNNFPISVSQIAEGMNNAGSALSASGNSLEKSIALLTAANTTVQNVSKSSTGLRTIAARLRKTTVELDDLGETVEEAKYQKVMDMLTGKGVKITENGQYRATYDILKDIARIWDQLTTMERAGIAEQLAGTRQQNVFYSIIEQFQEAEQAMEAMENSEGALQEAHETRMESIQAHVGQMKAAYDELSKSFLNSGFAKGVVDVLRGVLELLTKIIDAIGTSGLIASIAAITIGIKALRGTLNPNAVITICTYLMNLGPALAAAAPAIAAIAAALAACVIVGKEWQKAHPTYDDLKKSADEAKKAVDELQAKIDANNQEIEKFNELGDNITDAEASRLSLLKDENARYEEQLRLLKEIAQQEAQAAEDKKYEEAVERLDTFKTSTHKTIEAVDEGGNVLWSMDAKGGIGGLEGALENLENTREKYGSLIKDSKVKRNMVAPGAKEAIAEDLKQTQEDIEKYYGILAGIQESLLADRQIFLERGDKARVAEIDEYLDRIAEATGTSTRTFEKFKSDAEGMEGKAKEAFDMLASESELSMDRVAEVMAQFPEFAAWMTEKGWSADEVAIFINRMASDTEEAIDNSVARVTAALQRIKDNTSAINSAWSASTSAGGISAESVKSLTDVFSAIDGFNQDKLLEITANGIRLNADALDEFTEKYYDLERSRVDQSIEDMSKRLMELDKAMLECTKDTEEYQKLDVEKKSLLEDLNNAKLLRAEIEGATSAYAKFVEAQSAPDKRDPYLDIAKSYEDIQEIISQGFKDDEGVTRYLDTIFGTDRAGALKDNAYAFSLLTQEIEGTGFAIKDFFTEDSALGLKNFLDAVHELRPDLVQLSEDGKYAFDFSGSRLFEVADELNISVEAIQLMEQALEEAGFTVFFDSFSESAYKAAFNLQKLGGVFDGFELTGKESPDEIAEKIDLINSKLEELRANGEKIDLDDEGVRDIATVLSYLLEKQNGGGVEISVKSDVPKTVDDLQALEDKIKELEQLQADIKLAETLGQDTADLEERVAELTSEIETDPVFVKVTADVTDADDVLGKWRSEQAKKDVDVDTGTPDEAGTLNGTVKYTGDFPENKDVPKLDGQVSYTAASWPTSAEVPTLRGYVYYTPIFGGGGANRVDGTAHAKGTARGAKGIAASSGYWGTRDSGVALGGELGEELVVRDGHFFTIGSDSAEMFAYRKGDIIFNAEQTKEIFKKGKITHGNKRGHALVTGTAFDWGSGAFSGFNPSDIINYRNGGNYGGTYRNGELVDEPEKMDWIAVLIKRVEQAIDRLSKIASSGFNNISKRDNAAREEIDALYKEIDIQWGGYARYLAEAESVALPDYLKTRARNGEIDINAYDSDTKELIDEYIGWYEKALDCWYAVEDLHQSIAQLYKDIFDNAQKDYENRIDETDHLIEMLNKDISMAETRGYIDSTTFYHSLMNETQDKIDTLRYEYNELNRTFDEAMSSGEIDEYSEVWYEMKQAIEDVVEQIADANIQLEEYKNTIREIEWSYFDYALSRLSMITDETNFLISLMSNDKLFQDNGQFNDLGQATVGMHVINYDDYMAQADEYAKEMKRIQRELANDPYNKTLIERRDELLRLQRQSIQSAESEKDAVRDLVSQGIQAELDALQKLIDAYEESLDSAKDLYEYQKKVAEQTADIAQIEKQLSAYQNDTSEENRARVQKLQQQLKDARENLKDTEYDRSVSDQKKLLSELYDEYEAAMNGRLDDVDALMAEMIDGANANRQAIIDTINSVSSNVGYTITDELRDVMEGQFSNYSGMFDNVTSIHSELVKIRDLVNAMAAASGAVKAYAKGGIVDYTGLAAVHGSPNNPEMVLSAADTARFLEAAAMMRDAPRATDIGSAGITNGLAGGMIINGLSVSIPIEHVQDYNDMIAQMQRDPKFDRLINAITLDRAVGKGSLGKYGVRVS